ncbi:MAG: GNAT family N-acetyltransferase [Clostridia bacterium]|nr:GNAT family N-acetyltransferase [Clostridia bacterium]
MTEYRWGRPGEEAEILDFINLVFSQSARPHHFDALIPKVYAHSDFAPLHALAVTNGRIRGAVAMLPEQVSLAGEVLNGGYIGSVSVHEKARGEGHMKRLMAMQIDAAQRQGYDFLALGGRRQRYGYFGFEKSGAALEFSINADNIRHGLKDVPDAPVIRPLTGQDDPALPDLIALQARQPFFCRRAPDRFYETLTTYNASPFVISDAAGACQGWLVAIDRQIIEIVVRDAEFLPQAIKAWMKGRPSCTVSLPLWQRREAEILNGFAENCSAGETDMLRVLHWPRVLAAALTLKEQIQPLPDGRVVLEIDGQRWALSVRNGAVRVEETDDAPCKVLTDRQATGLLFTPYAALTESHPLLQAWLPLPLTIPVPDQF